MKINKILVLFGLFSSQLTIAQNNEALPQLIKQALEYSPRIKEQQQLLGVGDYRIKVQETGLKPQVSGEVSYSRVDPIAKATLPVNGEPREIQFQPHNNYNAGVGASYVIYDWGRFKAGVQKTLLEIQQQKGGIEALKHMLAYQVAQLYYGIIYLQKAIVVQEDQLKLIQENGKIISDRIKSGDALDYDAVQVQVRYKNAEIRIVDLQGQLEKQYIFLNSLIGSDARKLISINSELQFNNTKTDFQSAYNEAITNNYDLGLLKSKEEVLAQEIKISSMSSLPQLAANAALGIRNGYLPNIATLRPNSLLGVKLTIPIYTGKRGFYNTQIAKINLDAAKQSTEYQKTQISRDIENAFNEIKVANQKKELAAQNIFQAEYTLKLAKIRLTNGVSTPVEIQAAETGLEDAKFSLLQYDYQALLAKLEIGRLSGLKFW
ncbi:TolC family protein [Emticicia sp. SJ17W-69]|uniref:TolC family protein n=1 Tax=Emticicia sp. SJ17W-69 TaxID=3421657 RepID=UPI003EBC9B38